MLPQSHQALLGLNFLLRQVVHSVAEKTKIQTNYYTEKYNLHFGTIFHKFINRSQIFFFSKVLNFRYFFSGMDSFFTGFPFNCPRHSKILSGPNRTQKNIKWSRSKMEEKVMSVVSYLVLFFIFTFHPKALHCFNSSEETSCLWYTLLGLILNTENIPSTILSLNHRIQWSLSNCRKRTSLWCF